MSKWTLKLLLMLMFSTSGLRAAPLPSDNDILIIANRTVGQVDISDSDLKDIFLKRRLSWSNGVKVIPIHARNGSQLRNDFRQRVISMSAAEESIYWQRSQIRKGVVAPASFSHVLKAVFKLKGSIGYVYRHQYTKGVVNIVRVLPAD